MSIFRSKTIREDIEPIIKRLIELYEESDPIEGSKVSENRHEQACEAANLWWFLYSHLLGWSQAHFTGYSLSRHYPEIYEDFEIDEESLKASDTEKFELLGWSFTCGSLPTLDDADNAEAKGIIEKAFSKARIQNYLPYEVLRTLSFEILMSRSGFSADWRMALADALMGLNSGEVGGLVKPIKIKRQGWPYQLEFLKTQVVGHIKFRVASGEKKYVALEEVSEVLGQSTETLRDWEKRTPNDPDNENHLSLCHLVGKYYTSFENGDWRTLDAVEDAGTFRGVPKMQLAAERFKDIANVDLENIREKMRAFRMKDLSSIDVSSISGV